MQCLVAVAEAEEGVDAVDAVGDEVLEEGTETEVIPHQTPIPTMRIAVDRPCDEGITIDES